MLREIKKEVASLPKVDETVAKFEEHWIKPIAKHTNSNMPFLQNLDKESKGQINKKLATFRKQLDEVKTQQIQEKMSMYASYLIELKLTQIQANSGKAEMITNRILNDDFLSMKQTIKDVQSFEENVHILLMQYDDIADLLRKKLSLEEVLFFMDLPHKLYMHNLMKTAKAQKKIVRRIGANFVSLVNQTHPLKRR